MRNAFLGTLIEIAEEDPRIVLLTGDLGFMVLGTFAEKMPERFINVGVAEQKHMIGLATGLADAGLIPFVYSIATFASMRLLRREVETMPRGAAGELPFLNDLHGLSARAPTESIATELSRAHV